MSVSVKLQREFGSVVVGGESIPEIVLVESMEECQHDLPELILESITRTPKFELDTRGT